MLNTDEIYGGDRHTKSYPKRKLLPEFDDEAVEPTQPKTTDQPDRPPRGRDKTADDAARKSAHNLREHLDKTAGVARSIYGSNGHTSAGDCGRHKDYVNQIPVRNKHRTQQ